MAVRELVINSTLKKVCKPPTTIDIGSPPDNKQLLRAK